MTADHLAALTRHLNGAGDTVTLTFEELDALVGGLPDAAWWQPWYWSNLGGADAPAQVWLGAGFRVAALEPQGFVTFVRLRDRFDRLEVVRTTHGTEAVTGTLRLVDGAVVADDGAAWLLTDAFYAALPDGSWTCRVRAGGGPAFLVACWFSLREPGIRGRLIDVHGHELTAEEGRLLVDSLAGTGTVPDVGDDDLPGTDPTWSGVSLRAPDRTNDPDAAPMRDVYLRVRAEMAARKAAGLPEPEPPPRPMAPTGDEWRQGREVIDTVRRGMRVFDDIRGYGTVLSVVPQRHKTEALVRFDGGAEDWCMVFGILIEQPSSDDQDRRGPQQESTS